jgi:hypothetical protein
LGGAHLVIALHLPPPPPGAAEAFSDIVITVSPRIRYFTWEQRFGNGDSVIEVLETGEVVDHGPAGGTDHVALLHATCRLLGVAECIEAPLLPQTFGTARSEPFYNPDVRRAAGEDARRIAELTAEASAAHNSQDYSRAVALYEALLAMRLAVEGPENPDATNVHEHLATAQAAAGDLAAAERTCHAWWAMCRRHFPLDGLPTSKAIFELAVWVKKQGRKDEALNLLRYRAQLAELAHGANSSWAKMARIRVDHFDFW